MKSTKTSRFSKPSHILVGSIAACAVLGLASSASAANYNWHNYENGPVTTGNLWSTAANWTGAVPAADDTFRIELYNADAANIGGVGVGGFIIMNVNYSAGALGAAAFFGAEKVSIEQYFKTTHAKGVHLVNGGHNGESLSNAGATLIVKSAANAIQTATAGTIDGHITFESSAKRGTPTVEFAGGSWATGSGDLRYSRNEQNGKFKVTSASGTIRPNTVLVLDVPWQTTEATRFPIIEFKLATTGVAPIELQAGSNPLDFQNAAAGTNPFKLNVDASLYTNGGVAYTAVDVPLITHTTDTDRMFSAGNISITAVPVGKGAFVTQTNLGTTLTLADAGEWTGTTPTSWATATNWSGGTAPGAAIPIAHLPAGLANVTANLDGATPTLAMLNINSGAGGTSAYTIATGSGGNINLGATPTGSAFAAAQINVLKGTANTISAPVTLLMNGQVSTAASTTLTMSGAISGGFSLTKGGDGTLVLSGGAHSYSGATAIEGGVLSVSSLANAGANSDLGAYATPGAAGIVLNGGTLRYTSSGASVDRGFTAVGVSSTIDLPTAAATLTLGASSIGVGIVNENVPSLNVTGGAGSRLTLGAVTLASPTGEVWLSPTTANLTVASFTGTQNLTLGGTATDNSVTGVIGIGTGMVVKKAAGTWTLSGNNTYSGITNVIRGTLQVSNSGNLGLNTDVNALTINQAWPFEQATVKLLNDSATNFAKNVQIGLGGSIHVDRAAGGSGSNNTHTLGTLYTSWTDNRTLTITGGNGYGLTFGAYTADGSQTITNNAPGLLTLASLAGRNADAHTMTIRGTGNTTIPGAVVQTDTGALALTKNDAGTLVLSGGNSYSGTTTVSAGTLAAAHATALGTTGASTTVSSGATLDVRAALAAEPIRITGTGVGGFGALITAATFTGTVTGPLTLAANTSIGAGSTGTLNINGIVAVTTPASTTLTTLGTGVTNFGEFSTLTSLTKLTVTDGTTNVNSALGNAGDAVVNVSDLGNGTKLRFGSVSQTLSSLTIGAGATVIFTSGAASGSLTGDDGGGKAAGFGSPASSFGGGATVPEPGTLGLLLVGALGMLNRRRRA
jgi:fibronectin-binding autotransporter adhesin